MARSGKAWPVSACVMAGPWRVRAKRAATAARSSGACRKHARCRGARPHAGRYRLWDRQQLDQFPEVLCCGDLPKFFGPRLT
jgi:hypothetical protein